MRWKQSWNFEQMKHFKKSILFAFEIIISDVCLLYTRSTSSQNIFIYWHNLLDCRVNFFFCQFVIFACFKSSFWRGYNVLLIFNLSSLLRRTTKITKVSKILSTFIAIPMKSIHQTNNTIRSETKAQQPQIIITLCVNRCFFFSFKYMYRNRVYKHNSNCV